MAMVIDASGAQQQISVDLSLLKEAEAKSMSVHNLCNVKFATNPEKFGTSFEQILASEGISLGGNRAFGIKPTTIAEAMDGTGPGMQAGVITKEGVPASRILLPPAILQWMEDKLIGNLTMTSDAFEKMIAQDVGVDNDRYDQPIVNMDKTKVRSQGITQLAQPGAMMSITVSDKSRRVPTFSIGAEISQQAASVTTIDFVGLSLARQAAIDRNARVNEYLLRFLQGDVDYGTTDLSSAGYSVNATTLDPSLTAGQISQLAWMKFLHRNSAIRTIDTVVTDLATALKIENRLNKPTNFTDNPNSTRIDTVFSAMNPTWAQQLQFFIIDPNFINWPAGTVMALDSRYAIRRVTNVSASYSAMEALIMRRSTQLRVDFGEDAHRLFDQAFDCLVLA